MITIGDVQEAGMRMMLVAAGAVTAVGVAATVVVGGGNQAVVLNTVGPQPAHVTSAHPVPGPGGCTYRRAHFTPSAGKLKGQRLTLELPDPACTPGGTDPYVTDATLADTICRAGYTATVRPPATETNKLKTQLYAAYRLEPRAASELDHLIPLSLGGSNDAGNLWTEPGKVPNPKDTVENKLHKLVCAGTVALADAQRAIAADWTGALSELDQGKGGPTGDGGVIKAEPEGEPDSGPEDEQGRSADR